MKLKINKKVGIRQRFGLISFIVAMVLYATLSYPFPKSPGPIEAVIGLLLFLSVGLTTPFWLVGGWMRKDYGDLSKGMVFCFLFMVVTPTMVGISRSQDKIDMIRDLVPMIYLFIPVIMYKTACLDKQSWRVVLPWLLSFVGMMLAIRYFMDVDHSTRELGEGLLLDDKKYYSYDPTVAFAGVFLLIQFFESFNKISVVRLLFAACCLAGSMLCLGSLAGVIQRAPIGFTVLAILIYGISVARKNPFKGVIGGVVFLLVLFSIRDTLVSVFSLLMEKQQALGLNSKDSELMAVLDTLSENIWMMLFGGGFGATFHDPAVGNIEVSYTHSLFSYFLLKSGVAGVLIFIFFFYSMIRRYFSIFKETIVIPLALMSPIAVGLLFQSTYKALTYGVLLLLVMIYCAPQKSGNAFNSFR